MRSATLHLLVAEADSMTGLTGLDVSMFTTYLTDYHRLTPTDQHRELAANLMILSVERGLADYGEFSLNDGISSSAKEFASNNKSIGGWHIVPRSIDHPFLKDIKDW